jgi:hypothetical protein
MTYRARKDLWITGVIVTATLLMSIAGMVLYVVAVFENEMFMLIPAGMLLASSAAILWAFASTTYAIEPPHLLIRSGPLRFRLPLEDLEELRFIEAWNAPGWSLGWSQDKVGIRCRGRLFWYWISPEEREAFLRELRRHCPDLKWPGS